MEFKLTYFKATVQHFNYYAMVIPQQIYLIHY